MFGPLRRCSIVFIASVCSGFWMNVLETVSKFFQNLDKNLLASLYLSDCFLCVTTDGDLEVVTHKYPLTTPLHTSRPMGSLGFQHTETVMPRLQIKCHPCRLIFPFPPPPPPLYFFSLFSNSRANEPVRKLSNYLFSLYTYLYFIAI